MAGRRACRLSRLCRSIADAHAVYFNSLMAALNMRPYVARRLRSHGTVAGAHTAARAPARRLHAGAPGKAEDGGITELGPPARARTRRAASTTTPTTVAARTTAPHARTHARSIARSRKTTSRTGSRPPRARRCMRPAPAFSDYVSAALTQVQCSLTRSWPCRTCAYTSRAAHALTAPVRTRAPPHARPDADRTPPRSTRARTGSAIHQRAPVLARRWRRRRRRRWCGLRRARGGPICTRVPYPFTSTSRRAQDRTCLMPMDAFCCEAFHNTVVS
jgi:hypothetical protein